MAENQHNETQAAPPHAQLVQMAMAYWVSHIVYVAAKLSLPDHLSNGPKSAESLDRPGGRKRLWERRAESGEWRAGGGERRAEDGIVGADLRRAATDCTFDYQI